MIEHDLLLNAAAAVLIGCLAWQSERLARRVGRWGLALYVLGALLPFADFGLFLVTTTDRVELLSHAPWLSAPLYGLTLIAAVGALVAFAVSPRAGWGAGLCLAAGYLVHVALSLLTPAGWPLLAPVSAARVSLPILPVGHLPLLAMLFVAVLAAEALQRWRRWVVVVAAVLACAYGLAGAGQWGYLTWRVRGLATPGTQVRVTPDGPFLRRWLVTLEGPQSYALRRLPRFDAPLPEPTVVPRWNEEPLFLKLLGDPVVSRFYFRVFHQPVVQLDVSGSKVTLTMEEARDQSPPEPGPTFYLESDLTGRNRFYQLQRFN